MELNPNSEYVIKIVDTETQKTKYYARDDQGYPYFADRVGTADVMTAANAQHAFDYLLRAAQSEPRAMSDGTLYPHDSICRALALSDNKPKARAEFFLCEVTLTTVGGFACAGEIKKPTGYTYD